MHQKIYQTSGQILQCLELLSFHSSARPSLITYTGIYSSYISRYICSYILTWAARSTLIFEKDVNLRYSYLSFGIIAANHYYYYYYYYYQFFQRRVTQKAKSLYKVVPKHICTYTHTSTRNSYTYIHAYITIHYNIHTNT